MRTATARCRSRRRIPGYTLIAAAVFLFASQASWAQDVQPAPQDTAATQDADPPGRIARLNYTAGAVTTEPAGATDWSYAQINRPLTTGDQLWNDQNARSELHIGSTAVRLGQSTSLDVLNLDDNSAQLKVAQGTLSTRVRELPPGSSYEIDTPNLALGVNGPGDYRVDVAPDGSSTTVTVRSGSATVYGDGGQVPVTAGRQVRFTGTQLQQLADDQVPGLDSLDQWAVSRDAAEDRSVSARYVSRDIPGYQDLDANGTWRDSPQYGEVWVPRATPAGWAPYHDGHWIWQAPWGWTWVDDQPWGFAPYHYGRWAQVDDTWAWVPGPVEPDGQPAYAPALVAFVGDDEGAGTGGVADWGVNLAIGGVVAAGVAWFPLGPGEPWHPHWRGHDHWSPGYYDRINRTTIVNNYNRHVDIHNTYVNYRARGGLTAVPATAFVHGQPVGRFAQKVDPREWRHPRINAGAPGIAPVRESFGPGQRNANYRPPAGVAARPVVATRSPALPAAYRDSLAQRFAQGGGRVPGGGPPVVRTSVPAQMAAGTGAMPVRNVRVVQSHIAGRTPGAAQGAPVPHAPAGVQQVGQRPGGGSGAAAGLPHGAEPQARPGMLPQVADNRRPQQAGETGRGSAGVPRPPQAGGGSPGGYPQQRGGMPDQPARQPGVNAGREPIWTQPHTPMAQQRGGPQGHPGQPSGVGQQQPGVQGNARMQPHGVPRSGENSAMQLQGRQQGVQPSPQTQTQGQPQVPRPTEVQAQQGRQDYRPGQLSQAGAQSRLPQMQASRSESPPQQMQPFRAEPPRPQQVQQATPEPRSQQVQQARPEPRPPQIQQPRSEPRPQQIQQPRPEPRPQQVQQPRPEPRPQQVQQPRPEPRPQQVRQPRPEPRPQQVQQPRPEPRPAQVQQPRPQPQQQHADQHPGGGNRDEHHKG
ncbi:FecR protein [Paraburkholderia strydomiana]|uniref:FecR protein n=1 Tax=Paraburkholderia strydomiana TaxID=1245417 RepID=A0ABW9EJB6_9BURK